MKLNYHTPQTQWDECEAIAFFAASPDGASAEDMGFDDERDW